MCNDCFVTVSHTVENVARRASGLPEPVVEEPAPKNIAGALLSAVATTATAATSVVTSSVTNVTSTVSNVTSTVASTVTGRSAPVEEGTKYCRMKFGRMILT